MLSSLSSFIPTFPFGRDDKDDHLQKENKVMQAALAQQSTSDDTETEGKQNATTSSAGAASNPDVAKSSVDEMGVRRRPRQLHETFIVVRPPPAKSNHPLNLQLQLVPPSSQNRSSTIRQSVDLSAPSNDASSSTSIPPSKSSGTLNKSSMSRPPSQDISLYQTQSTSSLASTASVSSTASASSTASGGRRIIPLYNLSAHNVMTNTILDAGTDARIAKFTKRGIDLVGLAALEVVESWGVPVDSVPSTAETGSKRQSSSKNAQGNNLNVPGLGHYASKDSSIVGTPTSSAHSLSLASENSNHDNGSSSTGLNRKISPLLPTSLHSTPKSKFAHPSGSKTPTPADFSAFQSPTSPNVGSPSAKKFLGRIFKKKDNGTATPSPRSTEFSGIGIGSPRPGSSFLATSSPYNASTPLHSSFDPSFHELSTPSSALTPTHAHGSKESNPNLCPPILGVQAILLRSPIPLPPTRRRRPSSYIWIAHKWYKGRPEGFKAVLGAAKGVGMAVNQLATNVGSAASAAAAGGSSNNGLGGFKEFGNALREGNVKDPAWVGGLVGGVEVRFEWVRGVSGSRGGKTKKASTGQRRVSHRSSDGSLGAAAAGAERNEEEDEEKEIRASERSRRASSTSSRRSGFGLEEKDRSRSRASSGDDPESLGSGSRSDEDPDAEGDGEDSDPEDSETPWTCTVALRRPLTHAISPQGTPSSALFPSHNPNISVQPGTEPVTPTSPSSPASLTMSNATHTSQTSQPSFTSHLHTSPPTSPSTPSYPPILKLKLASLSPAPHHPKIVAQLKVLYPLPDIDIEGCILRKRKEGVAPPPQASGQGQGLILTAEEIKDVLCSSALWVVVREGFGGVGRDRRPGDGWRLRG
ncbi:hypothetical protein SISSUDRAFT_1122441 [Sistotremastrum suecicum HHB10207 ss-3]|uniref:Uncharacterized protein n=1 Tax=Sistotremastrum suecicum HHB10207 ss-3 TaxID=1314776 RepID=A0A165ZCH1_9AGAM|nr:hypothetical protein SISSUDRAFT_1122441 [Sistotremastrum suecicum HHB10207 ss-3]